MKVLLVATSLKPEYGGPARSVSGLAEHLSLLGNEVVLTARDGSAATTPFLPSNTQVIRHTGSVDDAFKQYGKMDVVHDNGIWLSHNHRVARLARQFGVPRIVSTRGMLERWAMNHKWLKKRFAWHIYQRRDLKLANRLHATSESERETIESLNLQVQVSVIPNGVDLPSNGYDLKALSAGDGLRTALFVGRIHPVKGLRMLVEAWTRVRPNGWRLQLIGPDEAGHQAEIERTVRQLGLQHEIIFAGSLEGRDKEAAFRKAELLILPSFTENFGLVVGEALSYSVPAIATKGTPWSSLTERQCGWWVDTNTESIAHALAEATTLSPLALHEMGTRGSAFVKESFGWKKVASEFIELYKAALH